MNKNILAIIISVLIVGSAIFYVGTLDEVEVDQLGEETAEESGEMAELIDCLAENDLVIYGAEWCPACTQLAESFGGYESIDPIYVECAEGTPEEARRCEEETKTGYVPEIQIAGELYEGATDPASMGDEVGCNL